MRAPRLLASIACGQMLGILSADFLPGLASDRVPLGCAAVVAIVGLCVCRLPLWFRVSLGAALVAGALHTSHLYNAEQDRLRLMASGSVSDSHSDRTFDACVERAELRASGSQYVMGAIRAADGGAPLPRRAEWFPRSAAPSFDPDAPRIGDCFRMRARLRAIRSFANPGASDRERAKARKGLAVRITLVGDRWIAPTRRASTLLRRPLDEFRRRLAARFFEHGRAGGLLAALSLGDRRGLDPDDRDVFARLGIAHVLAVSGLHLTLVAGLAFGVAGTALRQIARHTTRATLTTRLDARSVSLAAAAVAATAYALLSGPGVAALRAWLVVVAAAAGFALGRPGSVRSGFWLAAAALLAWDPASLFDLGAQLSFGATAALLYASPRRGPSDAGEDPRRRFAGNLLGWTREALRASAAAIAGTAPFLAVADLDVAPFGLASNLVAIPWVGFVLLPASLIAAAIASLPGFAAQSTFADCVLQIALAAAQVTLGAASAAAAVLPALPMPDRPAWSLVAVSACAACLAVRAASTRARLALCLLCVAIVRLPISIPIAMLGSPSVLDVPPTFVALDVGSGDALLLRAGAAAVLVDAGVALEAGPASAAGYDLGAREVLPSLRSLGVRRLDVVVATHADADHVGGLPSVLRALPVGALWLPAGRSGDPGFAALLIAARECGIPVREVGQGTPTQSLDPAMTLEVLWPPLDRIDHASRPAVAAGAAGRNDASIVLRARLGEMRVMLTGDLGEKGERLLLASLRERDVAAEVLKVGHHGSATSSSAAWLAAVSPRVAVLSAGCGRSGLPSPLAFDRLRATGAAVWWTGAHGAVTIGLAGRGRSDLLVTAQRLQAGVFARRFDGGCQPR